MPSPPSAERIQRTGTTTVATPRASRTAMSEPPSGCSSGGAKVVSAGIPNCHSGYSRSTRWDRASTPRTSPAAADQRWRRRTASQASATASAAQATGTAGAPSWTKAAIASRATPVPATRLPNRCCEPLAAQEPGPDDQVRERRDGDERPEPRLEVSGQDDVAAPQEEHAVCEHEGRARRAEVVAADPDLLAGGSHDVDEPEPGQGDQRLGRVGVADQPARELREPRARTRCGGSHAPRAEQRDGRRADRG